MDAIVYDLEIRRAILNKDEGRKPGIEYAAGFEDYENLGISVVCAYDFQSDRHRVFMEDNLAEFRALLTHRDLFIGFNNAGFDNRVLHYAGVEIPKEKCYDILVEVWKAAGLSPTFQPETHIGYGLEALCLANGLSPKSGHGAKAPIDWQEGRIGSVVDYCLQDVRLTTQLFERILATGRLRNPMRPGEWLYLGDNL